MCHLLPVSIQLDPSIPKHSISGIDFVAVMQGRTTMSRNDNCVLAKSDQANVTTPSPKDDGFSEHAS
jgi:hypothetical protein